MKAMKTTKAVAFLLALAMAFLAPGCSSPTLAGKGEQVADYRWACPSGTSIGASVRRKLYGKWAYPKRNIRCWSPQGEEVEKGIVYLELKSPHCHVRRCAGIHPPGVL